MGVKLGRDRLCGLVVRVSGYRYRGPGFDPRRYQIFWVVVGLERGPLCLVRLNWGATWIRFRKKRLTAVGTRCANHVTTLYPQKLALTSPTGGGRSVGMVRSRTKATEFSETWSLKRREERKLRVCLHQRKLFVATKNIGGTFAPRTSPPGPPKLRVLSLQFDKPR